MREDRGVRPTGSSPRGEGVFLGEKRAGGERGGGGGGLLGEARETGGGVALETDGRVSLFEILTSEGLVTHLTRRPVGERVVVELDSARQGRAGTAQVGKREPGDDDVGERAGAFPGKAMRECGERGGLC